MKKLETFDLNYLDGRKWFGNNWSQNYLIFQPISNTIRMPNADTESIIACKSKKVSHESIKSPTTQRRGYK